MLTHSIIVETTLYFPDGSFEKGDAGTNFHIGEKLVIENMENIFVVSDVRHFFKRRDNETLSRLMTDVILRKVR